MKNELTTVRAREEDLAISQGEAMRALAERMKEDAARNAGKARKGVVEENGCFEIVKMEMVEIKLNSDDPEAAIIHNRAASERTFVNHFGNEIVDELFERTLRRKLEFARMVDSSEVGFNGMYLAVLKRK